MSEKTFRLEFALYADSDEIISAWDVQVVPSSGDIVFTDEGRPYMVIHKVWYLSPGTHTMVVRVLIEDLDLDT